MHNMERFSILIDREIEKMGLSSRLPHELYMPVDYAMSAGGKRFRPVICLMACEMFSGSPDEAITPAVAIEIFHNFTLLHDDIMDKADLRRNKPTVHKKWNENTALLSGDAMMVLSFEQMSSVKPELLPRLLPVFNKTALEVCEGQQLDMNFETTHEVTPQMYMEMIRLKTSVLIAASLKIGALCGGASEKDANLMYDSGINLGMAFQIQDDLLDLYGQQEKFGKKPGGDILLNKKTILPVTAFQMADKETAQRLDNLLKYENDPDLKITEIKKIFEILGIRKSIENEATNLYKAAIEKINSTSPGSSSKSDLTGLIETVMGRRS